jgi:hypothetical protein
MPQGGARLQSERADAFASSRLCPETMIGRRSSARDRATFLAESVKTVRTVERRTETIVGLLAATETWMPGGWSGYTEHC